MTSGFEPLTRKTLSNEVRDLLMESIRSGRFPPGSALPSERTLSSELGVARTSVREAIQGLISIRVIERRGNRACVAETLPELDLEVSKRRQRQMVRKLFEVRRIIEVPAVRLAAERATAEQRREIAATAALARPTMSLPEFRALDRRFHALVARAADNPILAEVELKVLESLAPSEDVPDGRSTPLDKNIVRESAAAHKEIARAIAAADPDAAVAAATRHLDDVEKWMLITS